MKIESGIDQGFCNQSHELLMDSKAIERNQSRVFSVVVLSFFTMLVEIVAGRMTGSMALEADGYHMASHAGALGIAFLAYKLLSSSAIQRKMNFGAGKILALGGYTSAIGLAAVALWMIFESSARLMNPQHISFLEALYVACAGLFVNLLSAWLLGWGKPDHHAHDHHAHAHDDHAHAHDHHAHDHHAHDHHAHDHNHQGALMHVLADALTSVLAIAALLIGRNFSGLAWLDPLMGIIGAIVILRWAWSLLKQTSFELLDCHPLGVSMDDLKKKIENDGHRVWDLHVWSQGRGAFIGMLSVTPANEQTDFKEYFKGLGQGIHLSVERVAKIQIP